MPRSSDSAASVGICDFGIWAARTGSSPCSWAILRQPQEGGTQQPADVRRHRDPARRLPASRPATMAGGADMS